MSSYTHRLERLEARYPSPPDPPAYDRELYRAWLATVPDDDLELMVAAREHLEAHGSPAGLPQETIAAMARIMGTWKAFQAEAQS